MSTYDLEQQEKLAELKAWWKRYGTLILFGFALALGTVAAYRFWDYYQQSQARQASALYAELNEAAESKDTKKVRDVSGTILEQFPRTAYAPLAALVSAKVHFESGDSKNARAQLQWVLERARDANIQAIARVRLAYILLDEKAYDEALKMLAQEAPASFEALFADARGDIHVAQGDKAAARAAYQSALDKTPISEKPARDLLQMKLDALGEA